MRLTQLDIPARPEFVSLARLVVSSIADDRYEIDDDRLDNLKLAVSEACVLAIDHPDVTGHGYVAIECDGNDHRLDVRVGGWHHDDVSRLRATATDALAVDGDSHQLGLPLIGSLVDEIAVEGEEHPALRMTVFCERAEQL